MSNQQCEALDCAARQPSSRRKIAGRIGATLVRWALPQLCELCVKRTEGALLCAACNADLARVTAACPVCALPSQGSEICGTCVADRPPYRSTVAALVYTFPADRLLQRIKYGGRLALACWAGDTLAAAACASLAARRSELLPDRIVALPLAEKRQRERGYNQAREIAVRVAEATGLPMATPLARTTAGVPQAALPWAERRKNVRGAFAVQRNVRDARIALVDDVMTTGATLGEATRVLLSSGARFVECWVVARTLPP